MWTKVFGFDVKSNREPLNRAPKVTRRTKEMVCVCHSVVSVSRILLARVERIRKTRKWYGDLLGRCFYTPGASDESLGSIVAAEV